MYRSFLVLYGLLLSCTLTAQHPPQLIPFRDGDRWGYADTTGRIVVPVQYEEAWPFVTRPEMLRPYYHPDQDYTGWPALENPIGMVKKDGLYGLLDAHGRELTRPVSPEVFTFYPANQTCYTVSYPAGDRDQYGNQYGKLAVLTASGLNITAFRYASGYESEDGWGESDQWGHSGFYGAPLPAEHVIVHLDWKCGVVSAFTGEELIEPVWHNLIPGSNRRYIAYTRDSLPLIGPPGYYLVEKGNRVISSIPYALSQLRNAGFGLLEAWDNTGRIGFLNENGEIITPFIYKELYGFTPDGIAKVHTLNGVWQLIDTAGRVLLPLGPEGKCWKIPQGYIVQENDGVYYIYNNRFQRQSDTGFPVLPQFASFCGIPCIHYYYKDKWHLADALTFREIAATPYGFGDTINQLQDEFGRVFHQNGIRIWEEDAMTILDCQLNQLFPPCSQYTFLYSPNLWGLEWNGKMGVYDTRLDTMLIPSIYDEIRYNPGFARFSVRQGTYWGMLDSAGNEIIPVIFERDFWSVKPKEYELAKSKNGWYVVDTEGKYTTPLPPGLFDDPDAWITNFALNGEPPFVCIAAKVNGRPALFDLNGETLIPPDFEQFLLEKNNVLVKQNGKWGVLSFPELKQILPIAYTGVQCDGDKFRLYQLHEKGFEMFDPRTGSSVKAPTHYGSISWFSDGMAAVQTNCRYGFIDTTFKEIIPLQFAYAYSFSEGLASVQIDDKKWGFIDKTGKMVIPARFTAVEPFHHGFAIVHYEQTEDVQICAVIDRSGREQFTLLQQGTSGISKAGPYFIIHEAENRHTVLDSLLHPVLEHCMYLTETMDGSTLFQCYCDGKAGAMTYDGRIIPDESGFRYEHYQNGNTGVSYMNLWGLRNPDGNWIIPMAPQSGQLASNSTHLIQLWRSEGLGIYDTDGKEIIPCRYNEIQQKNGYWEVRCEDRIGLYDLKGRMLVPAKYSNIEMFPQIGLIKVSDKYSGSGFYDFQGRKYFR